MSFSLDMIKKYNLRLSKKWGQNFLKDERVLKQIVEASSIEKTDLILEIGPGVGVLTRELAKKAGYVLAVEIDTKLIPALNEVFSDSNNVQIINADALTVNFSEILPELMNRLSLTRAKVVANLPYYITTPLIMKFLEEDKCFDTLLFMVQKEVANRIVAKPGKKDFGAFSVAVQYHSTPSIQFEVSPDCFIPPPEVTSAVVKFEVNKEPPVDVKSETLFFKVVKASFAQRRKTLLNALSNNLGMCLTKTQIGDILELEKISLNQRGETLDLGQFAKLANRIFDVSSKA